jgi:hypothetical protein
MRLLLIGAVLVCASRGANAACVISGVRPTVALPTMASGQEFLFIATAGCETVRFRVPGTRFAKIPRAGPDDGSKDRTYKVVLTESEWDSLVDEDDKAFRWSIIGTTSAGVETRVTTTNALKGRDLSQADAKLVGERAYDRAGSSVSGAGDVDGDGHDDLLVGTPNNRDGRAPVGAAYLVLGPVTGTLDLSLADAKLVGEQDGDFAGSVGSVSGAGDVDGDGHDDLLVGASGNDPGGAAYLVLGPVTGTLNLSWADAKLVGEGASDFAGQTVSGAGDVDGDGHDDLLVGARFNDQGGAWAGAAYLVLGPVTTTRLDLSLAEAKLVGETPIDYAGNSVSGAGDVDADGHDDVLVGAYFNDRGGDQRGAAYLVLGPVTGTLDLSLADAKLVGEKPDDHAGWSVSGAGDVDGDGHDDLLVGAPAPYHGPGAAYLVRGPVTGTLDLSLADAKLLGEKSDEYAGRPCGQQRLRSRGRRRGRPRRPARRRVLQRRGGRSRRRLRGAGPSHGNPRPVPG